MKKRYSNEPRAKDVLHSLDVAPSKGRGQNFAIDPSVINFGIEFGAIKQGEKLVEIGPGLGALTAELVKFGELTVIEIENKFCERLSATYPNIKIINSDVRTVDFSSIGHELTVFGNVPYSFSTDIVFHLIENRASIKRAILLLQKEFAERLAAKPSTKAYGSLSVAVQLWANLKLGPKLPGTAFHPPAKVESQFIELEFLKAPRVAVDNFAWFEKVVRASFTKKRKMVHNSLRAAGIWTGEEIDAALLSAQLEPTRRAETFSLQEFLNLSIALAKP